MSDPITVYPGGIDSFLAAGNSSDKLYGIATAVEAIENVTLGNTTGKIPSVALAIPAKYLGGYQVAGSWTSAGVTNTYQATQITVPVTSHGGPILVQGTVTYSSNTANAGIAFALSDPTGASAVYGLISYNNQPANTVVTSPFVFVYTGLAAGSHTFTLFCDTNTGTVSLSSGSYQTMWVVELSA